MCIHIYRLCELVKTSNERKQSGETVGKGGMEEGWGREGKGRGNRRCSSNGRQREVKFSRVELRQVV